MARVITGVRVARRVVRCASNLFERSFQLPGVEQRALKSNGRAIERDPNYGLLAQTGLLHIRQLAYAYDYRRDYWSSAFAEQFLKKPHTHWHCRKGHRTLGSRKGMEKDDHDDWGPHDVLVQIGVGEDEEFIHLHKSVLIKHSGFFAALLSKRWPKGKCSNGMPVIVLGVKDDKEVVTPAKGPAADSVEKNVAASSSKAGTLPAESKQDASNPVGPVNDDATSSGGKEGHGENDEENDDEHEEDNEDEIDEEEEQEDLYYRGVLRTRYNAYSIALDLMYDENYKAVVDSVSIALDLLEVAAELQYDALIEYCCTFLEASRWSEDELVRIQDAIRPLQLPAARELLQRAEPVSGSNCIGTLKVAFLSALEQDKDYLRGTFHKLLSTAVLELGDELLVASFLDVVTAKIDGALAEVATGLAMPSAGSGPSARRRTFLKYHVEKALWIMGVLREMGAIPEIVFAWSKCRTWLPKAIPETECKRLVGQFSLEVLEGLVGAEKGAIACASMATVGMRPPQLRSALVDMIAMSWGLINDTLASEMDATGTAYDKGAEVAKRKMQKGKFRELLQTLPDANELLTKWFQEKSYAQLIKSVDLSPSFEVFCRRVRAGKRKLQEDG